jgi:hypothetical protein
VYHGTQIRHLPGIFSSGKVFGYWSSDIDTAISFSLIMGPEDSELILPPDKHSLILAIESDPLKDFEPSGDPTWFSPIEGYIDASRIVYGLRYVGPLIKKNMCDRFSKEDKKFRKMKNWKKLSPRQLMRFTKRRRSLLDGMLFVEPDPFALAFKELVLKQPNLIRSIRFLDRDFHLDKTMNLYDVSEELQHDCDNTIDIILLFDEDGMVQKFISSDQQRDVNSDYLKSLSIEEIIRMENSHQNRSYCMT